MVTTAQANRRAVMYLDSIELTVHALPEVEQEWGQLGDLQRAAWSIDWDNEMSKLRFLAQDCSAGLLTADQQARYRDLLRQLGELLPTIERLDLYRPPVPLK